MSKITDTLKEAAKDVLTEETLEEIQNTFNEQLESKADERSKIAVAAALNEQDEKYAEKLEALLEAIGAFNGVTAMGVSLAQQLVG